MPWRDHLLVGIAATCSVFGFACSFAWDDYAPSEANAGAGGIGAGGNTGGMGGGVGGVNTGGGGMAAGGTGGTGGSVLQDFTDDFERPDGDAIGFGWIEKTDDGFSLAAGRAIKVPNSVDYRDNMVYRPVIEDVRDVSVSVEFELTAANASFPQVFARAQPETIVDPNAFDGYVFYITAATSSASLSRQAGTSVASDLADVSLLGPLVVGTRYRITLNAIGGNPVELNGIVEREDGADWTSVGNVSFSDGGASRIFKAGSVGFSASGTGDFFYDNFTRKAL